MRWRDRSVGEAAGTVAAWLAATPGPMRVRPVVVATVAWSAVTLALRAVVPWGFMINDDHSMMVVSAGLDGGVPDPRVGYQHVLLGRLLVGLGRLVPDVPWYGVLLIALELLALVWLTTTVLRLAPRATRATTGAVLVVLVATGATLLAALQFTVVAVLAAAAAILALVPRALEGDVNGRSIAAVVLTVLAASFVRPTGAVLGAGIGMLALVVVLPRTAGRPRSRAVAAVGVALVLVVGFVAVEDAVFAPDPVGTSRMRSALYPAGTSPFAPQSESWLTVAERLDPGGLSENDREMVARWVHPTPALLALEEATSPPVGGAVNGVTQGRAIVIEMARTAMDPSRWGTTVASVVRLRPSLALALVAVALAGASGGRARATLFVAALAFGGLVLLAAATRSPLWVVVPSLVAAIVATYVASVTPTSAGSPGARPRVARVGVTVSAVAAGIVAVAGVLALVRWTTALEGRRDELMADVEVIAATVTEGDVVGLWISGLWRLHDPLAPRPADVIPFPTTLVADWPVVLPYHVRRHEDLGMVDWIDALARREDVLLLSGPKKVEAVRVHLAERRGWVCPTPVVAAELPSGDLLVRGYTGRDAC